MPPVDREAALKTAEKLLRQGRIDGAIAEYARVVAAQPRDWNTANALGDLYVRANQPDAGIAQYARIADHLAAEGFYPKAAALYKKILKVRSGDEHALLQSGEIAAKQGLLADAKQYLKAVAEGRRARGDRRGAAEINIRLGGLDPDDLDARLAAARAAVEVGDAPTALQELREVASRLDRLGRLDEALAVVQEAYTLDPGNADLRGQLLAGYLRTGNIAEARAVAEGPAQLKQVVAALEASGRSTEALDVLAEVAQLDPGDVPVRAALAQAFVAQGALDRARQYLDPETAGDCAPLWLTLAEIELTEGRLEPGRAAVARALSLDGSQRNAAIALGCRLAERSAEAGYPCIDVAADDAVAQGDFAAAAAALHEFVTRVNHHLVALMRLVEVCVDGGLEATMYEAQAQLADAYLQVGRGLEARIISEDLVAREPWDRANIERFRRALVMLGESDPDLVVAERLSGDSPFLATDKMDLNEGFFFEDEPAAPGSPSNPEEEAVPVESPAPLAAEQEAPATPAGGARSLDQVFSQLRDEVERDSGEEAAAEQYALALTYHELGMTDDAIEALQVAAQSARLRFDAASLLGRLYSERGEATSAVEWLEQAAEAPAPTPDAAHALLYDLAGALESAGEPARALAILVELEADARGFRDVADRIERLSRVQVHGSQR